MAYAHLISRKLLVFSPFVVALSVATKRCFFCTILPVVILESALKSLLYVAVNYYICSFKYTIWGLDPWNSNLLFSFATFFCCFAHFFHPAKTGNGNCCWRNAIRSFIRLRVVILFSLRFLPPKEFA